MDQLGKILSGIVDPERKELATHSTISPVPLMSEKWTAALFKRFQARYGHKWVSVIEGIEQTVVAEWSKGLSGFTADEIKVGLIVWCDPWPPSLPEFKSACRAPASNQIHRLYLPPPDPYAGHTKQQRIDRARPFLQILKKALHHGEKKCTSND